MNTRRILLVFLCTLLALPPLACSLTPATVAPTRVLPSKTPLPPRPTRTPTDSAPLPSRPQATDTPLVLPTQRPTSDPATALFELDYGSLGSLFSDPFITQYGQALVVPVVMGGENKVVVVNFAEGYEATISYPFEFLVPNNAFALLKDGILIADYSIEGVDLWKLTAEGPAQKIGGIREKDMTITSITFSPDGKTLAIGYNIGEVRLYRTSDGALQRTIKAHNDYVMSVVYSWDGRYLLTDSTSFDAFTYVYNANTGVRIATLSEDSWDPVRPAFSPDGRLAAVSGTDGTHIFTTKDWQPTGVVLSGVWDGAFTCDSRAFMVDKRGETELYSLETGALGHTFDVGWLYCTADGKTVMIETYPDSSILTVRIAVP
jgi:DNA-binding beta-propeller fold protein YncE